MGSDILDNEDLLQSEMGSDALKNEGKIGETEVDLKTDDTQMGLSASGEDRLQSEMGCGALKNEGKIGETEVDLETDDTHMGLSASGEDCLQREMGCGALKNEGKIGETEVDLNTEDTQMCFSASGEDCLQREMGCDVLKNEGKIGETEVDLKTDGTQMGLSASGEDCLQREMGCGALKNEGKIGETEVDLKTDDTQMCFSASDYLQREMGCGVLKNEGTIGETGVDLKTDDTQMGLSASGEDCLQSEMGGDALKNVGKIGETKVDLKTDDTQMDLSASVEELQSEMGSDACENICLVNASEYEYEIRGTEVDLKSDDTQISLYASGEGTKRRKELHGSTDIRSLSGKWANEHGPMTLQAYKMEFPCSDSIERYSSFVLLIDTVLDSDISHAEINLNLGEFIVKSSVSPCGSIVLSTEQVEDAKKFHELFFNALFGKVLRGSGSAEDPKIFLLSPERRPSWNNKSMYFLLPTDTSVTDSSEKFKIDWRSIQGCAPVVDFMNARFSLNQTEISPVSAEKASVECKEFTSIHLADRSILLDEVKSMVVLAIHTGKLYVVLDVLTDMSAESPFDGPNAGFSSFSDYFHQKFGIVLRHPEQPLFLLKHSHNPYNLLYLPSKLKGGSSHRENRKKKPQTHARMPPELLISMGTSENILKTFYLIPSLMYRLESLMLASQLKEEIGSVSNVSCFLILEAITTIRCDENFSLERLELLGDSVLKYAVTCNLFLNFQQHQEGQLSFHRATKVCNATLHQLGIRRNLQGYIRDAPFDPQSWVAPGQIGIRIRDCKCDLSNSESLVKIVPDKDEDKFIIGRPCEKGHRWLCSKTISDCVEALIGAYYVSGGLEASKDFMRWLSMDVDYEPSRLEEFIQSTSLCATIPQQEDLRLLETKLNYEFSARGLLLEALTHPSLIDSRSCYQRLEFLGDAALDLLITWYLYKTHEDIDPGKLTVLRAASVSNENFGRVSVRNHLHEHLLHGSEALLEQVNAYVKNAESEESELPLSVEAPKVLGDIVESLAAAVLVDSKLDLGAVWTVFQPLLSPIATPSTLKMAPFCLLHHLSGTQGMPLQVTCTEDGANFLVELRLTLRDSVLVRQSRNRSKKAAKASAAALILKDLEENGLVNEGLELSSPEKRRRLSLPDSLSNSEAVLERTCWQPVDVGIKMGKGGARMALQGLCGKMLWSPPSVESTEIAQLRSCSSEPGKKKKAGGAVREFVSKMTLSVADISQPLEVTGEPRLDKKSSQDSAALLLLLELHKRGICHIKEV